MATTATKTRRKTAKRNSVKTRIQDLNSTLIETSEDIIDGAVVTGEKYQKLLAKSIKKSEPIIEKQVDLVFDTVETLKGQFDHGTGRFKKLIGWNDKTLKNWRKNAEKRVKNLRKSAEETIDNVQDEVAAIVKDAPKKVTPKAKKVTRKVNKTATSLTDINGVGPKMAKIFNTQGINTIEELASSTTTRIIKIIEVSGISLPSANPEAWIMEAKKLAK